MQLLRWIKCLVVLLFCRASSGLAQYGPEYDDYAGMDDPYGYDDDMGGGGGAPEPALASHIHGCVDLDPATFDKVVYAAQRPVFVAFYDAADDAQQLVTARWALDDAAEKLSDHVRLLLAKVDVAAAGGAALKARFEITQTPFFAYIEGMDQHTQYMLDFEDEKPADTLTAWLQEQAGQAAAIPALMPSLHQFLGSASEREAAMKAAQGVVPQLPHFEARLGVFYLKVMNSVIKKGDGYLQKEANRLEHLLQDTSNISPAKEQEFKSRKNVVDLFVAQSTTGSAEA